LLPWLLFAAPPSWWAERNVTDPARETDDFAPANIGQLKYVAKQASLEFADYLPGGAGEPVTSLTNSWATPSAATDDFAILNLGQLKAVGKLFYDRLAEVGYDDAPLAPGQRYPWTETVSDDDDFAAANLGQLKYVFSFDLRRDSDGDGVSDLLERARGTDPFVDERVANADDIDSDGLPNAWEDSHGLNSHDPGDATSDPDNDGLSNLEEFSRLTNPFSSDSDNDGLPDLTDPDGISRTPSNRIAFLSSLRMKKTESKSPI
jgi:hypothetical protein